MPLSCEYANGFSRHCCDWCHAPFPVKALAQLRHQVLVQPMICLKILEARVGIEPALSIENGQVADFTKGRIGTNGMIGDSSARVLHAAILIGAILSRVLSLKPRSKILPRGFRDLPQTPQHTSCTCSQVSAEPKGNRFGTADQALRLQASSNPTSGE